MAIKAQCQNEVKKVVTQADLDRKFDQVMKKLDEIIMILCEVNVVRFGKRDRYAAKIERNQKRRQMMFRRENG